MRVLAGRTQMMLLDVVSSRAPQGVPGHRPGPVPVPLLGPGPPARLRCGGSDGRRGAAGGTWRQRPRGAARKVNKREGGGDPGARPGRERRCPSGAAGAAPASPPSADGGEEGAQDPPFFLRLLLLLLPASPQPLPLSAAPRRLPPPPPAVWYTEPGPLSAAPAGGAASSAPPLPRGG